MRPSELNEPILATEDTEMKRTNFASELLELVKLKVSQLIVPFTKPEIYSRYPFLFDSIYVLDFV